MNLPHAIGPVPRLLCCVMLLAAATAARSQATTPAQGLLEDKFVVNLGAFVLGTDVKARLNGEAAENPDVDFDRTFGNDSDATRIRLDALWRITPKHHVRLMYFNHDSDRSRVLDQTIEWGDHTFEAGANVAAENKIKVYELAYEYAFMRQPNYEVAASFGLHVLDTSLKLSGAATITDANGNVTQSDFAVKQGSVTAPLPVIGIRGGWAVAPQWYLDAQVQFFKAKVGEYDGYLSDWRFGATWMFSRNFGVGLGYNRFTANIDVEKSNFDGRLRLGYGGVQIYMTGSF